ncbi:MAG: type II toxin-antitoxin system HicB family antitoxin [Candidatus Cloacimonetes bacterium]|nr:type II toxin-antitoxin system HicB family antitoxin [Candidatus Cloacimonadota bacterium]
MNYHFKVYKEDDGFWSECLELEGCNTQADTLEELKNNMTEVLNLYLSEPQKSNILFPLPDESINDLDIYKVSVEPKVAFAYLLRRERINNNLTQKEVAAKLGLKRIWSYQRLENPITNPSLDTIYKIKSIFPDFHFEFVF